MSGESYDRQHPLKRVRCKTPDKTIINIRKMKNYSDRPTNFQQHAIVNIDVMDFDDPPLSTEQVEEVEVDEEILEFEDDASENPKQPEAGNGCNRKILTPSMERYKKKNTQDSLDLTQDIDQIRWVNESPRVQSKNPKRNKTN